MKIILYMMLLLAFILDKLIFYRVGGVAGLTITNITMYTTGIVLIVSEVASGRAKQKPMPGVSFALAALIGASLSILYAKYYGTVPVSMVENARGVKELVFEPVLLYVFAFMLVDYREQGTRYLLLLVIVIGVLNFVAVAGAQMGIQIFEGKGYFEGEGEERFAGFVGNPNKTAYLICVLLPFQYYLFKLIKARTTKIVLAIVMLMGVYVVLLSGSRGGLLLMGLLFVGMAYKLKDMKIVYGAIIASPVIVLLVMAQATFFQESMDRVIRLSSGGFDTVSSGRGHIWGALLSDYTKDLMGMLFGSGFGAVKFMGIHAPAHNMYIRILIEFGFVGLMMFLYFVWSIMRYISKRTFDDPVLKFTVLAGAYVVIVGWLFTTMIGVLQLISITWTIAFATLMANRRDAVVSRDKWNAGKRTCPDN